MHLTPPNIFLVTKTGCMKIFWINKCSYRNIKVYLPVVFGNHHGRPTRINQQNNQQTDTIASNNYIALLLGDVSDCRIEIFRMKIKVFNPLQENIHLAEHKLKVVF